MLNAIESDVIDGDVEVIASNKAMVHVDMDGAGTPYDLPVAIFAEALERRKANRASLVSWVRSSLIEGSDYGRVSTKRGPSKPSLWKAGAEKIGGLLGVTVHYPDLREYVQAALGGVDLKAIILHCELRDATGRVLADGVGARSLAQDYGDLNKALKMAAKSAHIDATLRLSGLSEVFTQDLEDMPQDDQSRKEAPHVKAVPAPQVTPLHHPIGKGTAAHKAIEAKLTSKGMGRERAKAYIKKAFNVDHFYDLDPNQATRLMKKIDEAAVPKTNLDNLAMMADSAGAQRDEPVPLATPMAGPDVVMGWADKVARKGKRELELMIKQPCPITMTPEQWGRIIEIADERLTELSK
jgi:hypothetical protein